MKRTKLITGLFGAIALVAALTVSFWPTQVEAGAGECVLAATVFASGGPAAECKWAKQECKAVLANRVASACHGPRYTGEVCGTGSIVMGSCTGPKGAKEVDCQRDVYCEEAVFPPPF